MNDRAELDPAEVDTTTSTAPGATVAGVRTVIDVADTTVTLAPATPPKVTAAPLMKPVPVRVTSVLPAVVPDAGDTDASVGATAT